MLAARAARLESMARLLESVSYRRVLARGYALVHDQRGAPLRRAAEIGSGQALTLEFSDGKVGAIANGGVIKAPRKRAGRTQEDPEPSLFE